MLKSLQRLLGPQVTVTSGSSHAYGHGQLPFGVTAETRLHLKRVRATVPVV